MSSDASNDHDYPDELNHPHEQGGDTKVVVTYMKTTCINVWADPGWKKTDPLTQFVWEPILFLAGNDVKPVAGMQLCDVHKPNAQAAAASSSTTKRAAASEGDESNKKAKPSLAGKLCICA